MTRPAIKRVSEESGIPEEYLTTHADLFGLPEEVYGEAVCLRDDVRGPTDKDPVGRHADIYWKWVAYTWGGYMAGATLA